MCKNKKVIYFFKFQNDLEQMRDRERERGDGEIEGRTGCGPCGGRMELYIPTWLPLVVVSVAGVHTPGSGCVVCRLSVPRGEIACRPPQQTGQ